MTFFICVNILLGVLIELFFVMVRKSSSCVEYLILNIGIDLYCILKDILIFFFPDNLKLIYFLDYHFTHLYRYHPSLSLSVLPNLVVFCSGEGFGEGKGKRKASPDDDYGVSNKKKKDKLEEELENLNQDLKEVNKALFLDKKLPSSQKEYNSEADRVKKDYPSFFDEDSENNTPQGLKELKEYLEAETRVRAKKYAEITSYSFETKRIKQDSTEVVNDGFEPSSLTDLDGGE